LVHSPSVPLTTHPTVSTALPPYAFHIFLVTPNNLLAEAWYNAFNNVSILLKQMETVDTCHPRLTYSIYKGTFEQFLKTHKAEAIVSPANSFGLIDKGVDAKISSYYGSTDRLIPYVQRRLEDDWSGQQNPGTCTIVDLQELLVESRTTRSVSAQHYPRYLLHTPTMRLPEHLNSASDLVYRCTWAIFSAVRKHNSPHNLLTPNAGHHPTRISNVVMLGMGTGVGELSPESCAAQMALASKHFVESPVNGNPQEDAVKAKEDEYRRSYAKKVQEDIEALLKAPVKSN
ncbi:hypothetical protein BC937DRAFT_92953, partial [Endogone sp. FLAS-F59071]